MSESYRDIEMRRLRQIEQEYARLLDLLFVCQEQGYGLDDEMHITIKKADAVAG